MGNCHKDAPVTLHLGFLLVKRAVLDDQLAVANMLARLEPPLAQPHPRLQLVVVDSLVTEQEEEILLVALARLALHVPVVLPRHLVLVLLILLEVDLLKQVQ